MNQVKPNHLSYSSLSSLLRCPRSWKYKYVDNLPIVMTPSLIAGNVYHKMVSYLETRKMGDEAVDNEEIEDVIQSFWGKEVTERLIYHGQEEPKVEAPYIEWRGVNPEDLKKRVTTMAKVFNTNYLPLYLPIGVEQRYRAFVEGIENIPIVGYPDMSAKPLGVGETVSEVIIDHKWRARSLPEYQMENDIQSSFYTMLTGINTTIFLEALNQSLLSIRPRRVYRSNEDIDWLKDLIREPVEDRTHCPGNRTIAGNTDLVNLDKVFQRTHHINK
jgi:hypothetical protein